MTVLYHSYLGEGRDGGDGSAPAEVAGAEAEVDGVAARLRRHFRRRAGHRHAVAYVRGLLGDVERKNGWQLAEHAGYRHPRTIQRVLDRSAWDADEVRDDLRASVAAELGDPDGVLVVDETGFLKKGIKSAPLCVKSGRWRIRSRPRGERFRASRGAPALRLARRWGCSGDPGAAGGRPRRRAAA